MDLEIGSKEWKEVCIQQIYEDYPDLETDIMKQYCVEQLVEAYANDKDRFEKAVIEHEEKIKRGEYVGKHPMPKEIMDMNRITNVSINNTTIIEEHDIKT
jgi:hypothetical protein